MSEDRNYRGHRDRHGGGYRERETPPPRQQQQRTRPSSNDRSEYSGRNQSPRSQYRKRPASRGEHESKCSYICSRRGIVLICAFLCNLLVLFCVVAAYVSLSGLSAMKFSSGGFAGAVLPFQGTELQQVRDLDMQFSQMRAPGIYGSLAFSITLGVISLLFFMSGNKPAHLLSRKLLVCQCIFQLFAAVAYVTAVGLYLHFVIRVNSTEVCLLRERLYARNGQTWMNCNVSGADAAVALFGIIAAILYAVGTFLTARTIQSVNQYHKDRARYEAERPKRSHNSQDTPFHSDISI